MKTSYPLSEYSKAFVIAKEIKQRILELVTIHEGVYYKYNRQGSKHEGKRRLG